MHCADRKDRPAYGTTGITEKAYTSAKTGCHLQNFLGKIGLNVLQNCLENALCTVETLREIFPRPLFDADNFFDLIHMFPFGWFGWLVTAVHKRNISNRSATLQNSTF
jgi:hypothetical protein